MTTHIHSHHVVDPNAGSRVHRLLRLEAAAD